MTSTTRRHREARIPISCHFLVRLRPTPRLARSRGSHAPLRSLRGRAVRGVAVALACASISAQARAQNLHYGMNTVTLTPRMADKMTELGAGTVRLAFGWDVIEG